MSDIYAATQEIRGFYHNARMLAIGYAGSMLSLYRIDRDVFEVHFGSFIEYMNAEPGFRDAAARMLENEPEVADRYAKAIAEEAVR